MFKQYSVGTQRCVKPVPLISNRMDPHFYVVHVKLCLIVAVSDLATFCGELVRQFLMLSCLVCSSDVGGVSLHASSSSRVHICIGHTVMGLCGHTPLAYRQSSSGRLLSPLGSACLLCSLLFALGCSLQTSSLNEWTGLKWPLCSTWALKGLYVTCLIRPSFLSNIHTHWTCPVHQRATWAWYIWRANQRSC